MTQKERLSATELLGWVLAGLGVGLVAGLVLSEWLGEVNQGRLARTLDRWQDPSEPVSPLSPTTATRAALAVIHRDEALRVCDLEPIGVRAGVIELHGWVSSRSLRARAARLVAAVPGIESLINCILVHGEDDSSSSPGRDLAGQTA